MGPRSSSMQCRRTPRCPLKSPKQQQFPRDHALACVADGAVEVSRAEMDGLMRDQDTLKSNVGASSTEANNRVGRRPAHADHDTLFARVRIHRRAHTEASSRRKRSGQVGDQLSRHQGKRCLELQTRRLYLSMRRTGDDTPMVLTKISRPTPRFVECFSARVRTEREREC